jgi:hypothetical protein
VSGGYFEGPEGVGGWSGGSETMKNGFLVKKYINCQSLVEKLSKLTDL